MNVIEMGELCPLLALSGHPSLHRTCPLLGVKRTLDFLVGMSAVDPRLPVVCAECEDELSLSRSGHQFCTNHLCRDGFDVRPDWCWPDYHKDKATYT
jgi:hypothetical protein